MTDAGLLYIIRKLLSFRTKTEARAFISNEVGMDYAEIATDLAHRLEYHRTNNQNALHYKRLAEIAKQWGKTELEVRRYVKYHFGLPILFRTMPEKAELCRKYLGAADYDDKLAMMDLFAVSSLMKTTEMKEYMDQIAMHFRGQGMTLTEPEEKE